MSDIKLLLRRDVFGPTYTLGRLFVDGTKLGYTCEDDDRRLEDDPGRKLAGQTAIPRGTYRLTATLSQRFGRIMPQIMGVPGFEGVRIHGGNTAADTEGCPLLGASRTAIGVCSCKQVVEDLIALITNHEAKGDALWIEVQ